MWREDPLAGECEVARPHRRPVAEREFCGRLHFVGVARSEPWHGFDRFIEGLSRYVAVERRLYPDLPEVTFDIVDAGVAKKRLQGQAQRLQLGDQVRFFDDLTAIELDRVYSRMHVAVGILGAHRSRAGVASPMKNLEYTSRGIPYLDAVDDPDITAAQDFVYHVPRFDLPVDIVNVVDWAVELYR